MPRPSVDQLFSAAEHVPGLLKHTQSARRHAAEIGKPGKSKGQRAEHGLEIAIAVASGALLARRVWQALHPAEEKPTQK